MSGAPLLSTRGLTRDFGPFRAVDGVTLDIEPGTITGLIGPNGAGKTTLVAMVAGSLWPTAGQVLLNRADITATPPEARFQFGLARTFLIPHPFRRMPVLENLLVAPPRQRGEGLGGALFRRAEVARQDGAILEKARAILDFMTLDRVAEQVAGEISGG